MVKSEKIICQNIFKTKDENMFQKQYNLKWLELINKFEKDKANRLI